MFRTSFGRLVIIAVAVLSMGTLFAPPASSAVAGVVTFQAPFTLTTGFGLPILANNTANFYFSTITCLDFNVGKSTSGGFPCSISASGTVTGACGLASGWGGGSYGATDGHGYDFEFNLMIVGNSLTLTGWITKRGSFQSGTIVVEAVLTPNPNGVPAQSCFNKSQRDFSLVAEGVILLP